jgi:undecaprenyl-diphosphatase
MFDLTILTTLNHLAQDSESFKAVAVFAAQPLLWLMAGWYVVVFVWHKRAGLTELGALTLGAVLGNLVKIMLGWWWFRARPFVAGLSQLVIAEPWDAQSFPSGHAMFSFFLATLLYLHRRDWWWAYLIAAVIALARVAVGVHYPTDVIAGALIGTAFGFVARKLELVLQQGRRRV